jgi:hypothetical protein
VVQRLAIVRVGVRLEVGTSYFSQVDGMTGDPRQKGALLLLCFEKGRWMGIRRWIEWHHLLRARRDTSSKQARSLRILDSQLVCVCVCVRVKRGDSWRRAAALQWGLRRCAAELSFTPPLNECSKVLLWRGPGFVLRAASGIASSAESGRWGRRGKKIYEDRAFRTLDHA